MDFRNKQIFRLSMIFILIISTLGDYVLNGPNAYVTILSPSIGILLTYYFYKGKSVFWDLILTYSITLLISRLYFINDTPIELITILVTKCTTIIVMMLLFRWCLYKLPNQGYQEINLRDNFNYVIVGIVITLLGTIMNLYPIFFLFEYDNHWFWFGIQYIGYLFGFFIFGSSLHFSLLYDNKPKYDTKKYIKGTIFIVISMIVMYLMFSENLNWFQYHHFSYMFVVIYMFSVLNFNYSLILLLNMVTLIFYSLFHLNYAERIDLSTELFSIILVLFILTTVTVVTRVQILNYKNKEVESEKIREALKDIMFASNDMLINKDSIMLSSSKKDYNSLVKMFRIGTNILTKFDRASLFVKENGMIRFLDAVGYDIDYLNAISISEDEFNWTYTKPYLIQDFKELYSEKFKENQEYIDEYPIIKQSLRITIFSNDTPFVGMSFDITKGNNNTFNKEDITLYSEYQNMINSYYEIAKIQFESDTIRNDIVKSLVRTLGFYDSYTGLHSEEVAFLSLKIAERLDLPLKQRNRIYWSAVVHDIGKVGIKETVLNKSEPLTNEERQEVQDHSLYGFKILNSIEGLKDVAIRVKHHHERWDGTGYPDNLKGDEIPLCSQVLAVCDAVSAMSQDRVYSKHKSIDEIIGELYIQKGKQFSPVVADAMIEYIKETKLKEYFKAIK